MTKCLLSKVFTVHERGVGFVIQITVHSYFLREGVSRTCQAFRFMFTQPYFFLMKVTIASLRFWCDSGGTDNPRENHGGTMENC